MVHEPLLTATEPTLPGAKPTYPVPLAIHPPFTVSVPVPELPTARGLVPLAPMFSRPDEAEIPRSKRPTPDDSPVSVNVPEFVSVRAPVPEIVPLIVRAVVWLNWSVPLAVTLPVTLAPLLRITVSPGAIVPPLHAPV